MEVGLTQLLNEFRSRFSTEPRIFQAPGRVNLIGEHTDYNEGFVMPFAIDRRTTVAAALRDDSTINAVARDLDESVTIDLNDEPRRKRGNWIDYIEGTVRSITAKFGELRGADLLITSTVPIGAGLSSSAAIEIAVGLALLELNGMEIDRTRLAFAGQQAEHEFVGTRSGIMDQFAATFGRADNAMLLDCRSLAIEYIPIVTDEVSLVVIDTKVKHDLASSEYNTRREECEEGVEIMRQKLPSITSLRDMTTAGLAQFGGILPRKIARRCTHVVTENERTLLASDAFRRRDFQTAGALMLQSHLSLRDDYEVSCEELDKLVDTAMTVDGVLGSRMTGGGFGGCTVNLVAANSIDQLQKVTVSSYLARFGVYPDFYVFRPADGASEIEAGIDAR